MTKDNQAEKKMKEKTAQLKRREKTMQQKLETSPLLAFSTKFKRKLKLSITCHQGAMKPLHGGWGGSVGIAERGQGEISRIAWKRKA